MWEPIECCSKIVTPNKIDSLANDASRREGIDGVRDSCSSRIFSSDDVCDTNDQFHQGQYKQPPKLGNKMMTIFKKRKKRWLAQSSLQATTLITTIPRVLILCFVAVDLMNSIKDYRGNGVSTKYWPVVEASLIIGDSAIEIQEVDSGSPDGTRPNDNSMQNDQRSPPTDTESNNLILNSNNADGGGGGSGSGPLPHEQQLNQYPKLNNEQSDGIPTGTANNRFMAGPQASSRLPSGPLPPINVGQVEDITDGDKKSRNNHDYDINELQMSREAEKAALSKVLLPTESIDDVSDGKRITGKVVDFELTPAGGHNKAKIKKKKKKKKLEEAEEAKFKKWNKKKKSEKKAMEKKEKHHEKEKKEKGKKAKKKWGHEEHGIKKDGKFKKKKWGKKVKKGKGVKKGKKGKKFLKDVGHKNVGFRNVYHKEEWGKSNKWHDVKREKKWDEKSKKWKNKWNKEKGKKYKGDHKKEFLNKKKEGKKYHKEKKEKHHKFKKEKFEAGKKKKMEEHKKKKEGGSKKEEKAMKKKKKKKS